MEEAIPLVGAFLAGWLLYQGVKLVGRRRLMKRAPHLEVLAKLEEHADDRVPWQEVPPIPAAVLDLRAVDLRTIDPRIIQAEQLRCAREIQRQADLRFIGRIIPKIVFDNRDLVPRVDLLKQEVQRLTSPCTGVSAVWCPNHGDCKCALRGDGTPTYTDDSCPLHSSSSEHAEPRPYR